MTKLYHSYDKGRLMTEKEYVRHLSKKWLKENGVSLERLREIAPSIELKGNVSSHHG